MIIEEYSSSNSAQDLSEWLSHESESLGGPIIFNGDRLYDLREYPVLISFHEGERSGFLVYHVENGLLEILAIKSLMPLIGAGTNLLSKAEDIALKQTCSIIQVSTTNDNLDALRFYQRKGFVLLTCKPNSFKDAMILKGMDPDTRIIGQYGITIRDIYSLCKSPGRSHFA